MTEKNLATCPEKGSIVTLEGTIWLTSPLHRSSWELLAVASSAAAPLPSSTPVTPISSATSRLKRIKEKIAFKGVGDTTGHGQLRIYQFNVIHLRFFEGCASSSPMFASLC
jgi:hypothetical protein